MPSTIYQLAAPLSVTVASGTYTIEYMNIFKFSAETKRPNSSQKAYLTVWFAACDANGTEIIVDDVNENGEAVRKPLLAAVDTKFIDNISQDERDLHKAAIEVLFTKIGLPAGTLIEV